MDEEATFIPQVPQSLNEPQVPFGFELQAPQGFPTPSMPQPRFFPPMIPKAYQAYINLWYSQAKAQAQAQAGLGQFPMPPTATFPQPKLSKLIKEARTLGCETFSWSVDAVVARN